MSLDATLVLLLAALPLACQEHHEVLAAAELKFAPLARTSAERTRVLRTQGAEFELRWHAGDLALSDEDVEAWVRRGALAVATYYGCFPVARITIDLQPVPRSRLAGQPLAQHGGPAIGIELGADLGARELEADWVLVHEFVHLATPSLPAEQLWFEEGIVSYVEPIAREQCNALSMTEVVCDWVAGMPGGEPRQAERGMDRTHAWGRTCWRGALFFLLADLTIRERTHDRLGLQDALRAVQQELRGGAVTRTIDEIISMADAAVGVPVLRELYDEQAHGAVAVDLPALWTRVGLLEQRKTLHLDSSAPLAGALQAICEPPRSAGAVSMANALR